jgi:tripartite-type tricarboxylate transporter receptor subunit TctC
MKLPRRTFLHLAAGAAALPAVSRIARAQTYPSRPVRWIVGLGPCGLNDSLARLMGQWLSERLGQQFVIENRPGLPWGYLATEAVVNAPADGYTLLLIGSSNTINPTPYGELSFNFLRDISAVAGIVRVPQVMVMVVNLSFPARTVPEFIAYAKANPGKVNFASGGIGTSPHTAGELFKMMTGVDIVHVPYRGGRPALTDLLLAGQVQVIFSDLPECIADISIGILRPLAVTTATRLEALPDIPTIGDFVSGYETSAIGGVGAPRNTPSEIVMKLNSNINAALVDPKMTSRITELGGVPMPLTPGNFGKLLAEEVEKWAKVAKSANIKPE